MAEHDNVHRNQREQGKGATTSQSETGRRSGGISPEEAEAGHVEGPSGENLKTHQVGQVEQRAGREDASRGGAPDQLPENVKSPNSPAEEGR